MGKFLEMYNLLRLNHEEIENPNRILRKEIEPPIRILQHRKPLEYVVLPVNSTKEKLTLILKFIQIIKQGVIFPNSFLRLGYF